MLTADVGGSNSYRKRLWKLELQHFADESGLHVTVAHYPPGTGKWNKIEHRMFCHNHPELAWPSAGDRRDLRQLDRKYRDQDGPPHQGPIDKHLYEKVIKVSDEQFATVQIKPHRFHGDWNYTIRPPPS